MFQAFSISCFFFFFNDTATTEIYTLSLHDALPICDLRVHRRPELWGASHEDHRSEEHTSELQSRFDLVCRLLLEKKKIHTSALLSHPKEIVLNIYTIILYII